MSVLDIFKKNKSNITGIDHVAIIVKDMDRSLNFYHETVGLDILYDGRKQSKDKKSFLGNEEKSLIALTENPGKNTGSQKDQSVSHIAFRVDELNKAVVRLQTKGVNFIEIKKNSEGRPVAYHFLDPDGFELEIYNDKEKVAPY